MDDLKECEFDGTWLCLCRLVDGGNGKIRPPHDAACRSISKRRGFMVDLIYSRASFMNEMMKEGCREK